MNDDAARAEQLVLNAGYKREGSKGGESANDFAFSALADYPLAPVQTDAEDMQQVAPGQYMQRYTGGATRKRKGWYTAVLADTAEEGTLLLHYTHSNGTSREWVDAPELARVSALTTKVSDGAGGSFALPCRRQHWIFTKDPVSLSWSCADGDMLREDARKVAMQLVQAVDDVLSAQPERFACTDFAVEIQVHLNDTSKANTASTTPYDSFIWFRGFREPLHSEEELRSLLGNR